jgi:hypothetical protein
MRSVVPQAHCRRDYNEVKLQTACCNREQTPAAAALLECIDATSPPMLNEAGKIQISSEGTWGSGPRSPSGRRGQEMAIVPHIPPTPVCQQEPTTRATASDSLRSLRSAGSGPFYRLRERTALLDERPQD